MAILLLQLQFAHIIYRKRILVVLTDDHLRLRHAGLELLFQPRPEHVSQVPPLRVAVEHRDERLALLDRPQSRVVARLPRHQQVHVRLLQDVVPAARAHPEAAHLRVSDVRADGARHHDVPQTAQLHRQTLDDVPHGDGLVVLEVADGAVARGGVRLRGRGARYRDGPLGRVGSGDDVRQPGVQPLRGGVHGCVRAVDGDAGFGEVDERGLLRVVVCDGLEA